MATLLMLALIVLALLPVAFYIIKRDFKSASARKRLCVKPRLCSALFCTARVIW
jgi:uncharacterized protein (UPF0333 family)